MSISTDDFLHFKSILGQASPAELQRISSILGATSIQTCLQELSKYTREEALEILHNTPKPVTKIATQLIALRGDGPRGIVARINTVLFPKDRAGRLVRNRLFSHEFTFKNKSGRLYRQLCVYCRASQSTLLELISRKLLAPTKDQEELVETLKQQPSSFDINFIRKSPNHGRNFYTMIACHPKAPRVTKEV